MDLNPRCTWTCLMIALIVLPAMVGIVFSGDTDDDKKIIVFGYDTQLADKIPQRMEVYKESPFQGMVIGARLPRDFEFSPKKFDRLACVVWGNELTEQDFADSIRQLASRRDSQAVTELFMRFNVTSGNVDWFDDEVWDRRVNNS